MSIIIYTLRHIVKTNSENRYRKLIIVLLAIATIMASIFSWGVINVGTATRHRDKFIVLYIVIFALSKKTNYLSEQTRSKESTLEHDNGQ